MHIPKCQRMIVLLSLPTLLWKQTHQLVVNKSNVQAADFSLAREILLSQPGKKTNICSSPFFSFLKSNRYPAEGFGYFTELFTEQMSLQTLQTKQVATISWLCFKAKHVEILIFF